MSLKEELYTFAKILTCHRDVDFHVAKDTQTIDIYLLKDVQQVYDQVFDDYDKIGKTLIKTELFSRYRVDFQSLLYTIFVLNQFEKGGQEKLTTYYEMTEYEMSPLAIEMSRNVLMKLGEIFDHQSSSVYANRFILLFELILKKVNLAYRKQRIAMMSTAGRLIAREYR